MKTRSLLKLVAVVFIALLAQNLFAGQKYWVRGDGTWDSSDTTHWASSPNGTDSVPVPTINDTVYFTGYSFSPGGYLYTLGILQCHAIDMSLFPDTSYFYVNGNGMINVGGWLNLTDKWGSSPFENFSGTFQLTANTGVYPIHFSMGGSPMNSAMWNFSGTATWELMTNARFGAVNVNNGTLKTMGHFVAYSSFMVGSQGKVLADSTHFKTSTYFTNAAFSVDPASASDFSAAEIYSVYDTLDFNGGGKIYAVLHVQGKGFKYSGKAFFGDIYIEKSTLVMNAGDTIKFKTISSTTGYSDVAHSYIDTCFIWINNGTINPVLYDVDGGDNCLYFTRIVGVKATGANFHATTGSANPYVGPVVAGDYMFSPPLNYTYSDTPPTCSGGNDAKAMIIFSGGNPPYASDWMIHYGLDLAQRAFYSSNDTVTNLTAGTSFDVHVYDNYCKLYDETFTISDNAGNPGPIFDGYVLCGSDTVKYGTINLFYDDGSGKFELISSASIDTTGYYLSDRGSAGDYILQYVSGMSGDTLMPTYYAYIAGKDSAVYNWVDATSFNGIPCGVSTTTDIHVLKSLDQSGGTADVSGKIVEATGYQQYKFIEGDYSSLVAGEPIRDVGVGLGKVPGGSMLTITQTDYNGNYSFDSIPPGTYQVYVDLPGLPHTAFHTVTITGNDSITDQDYFVDSSNVFIVPPAGIKYFVKESGSLKAFPNPYSGAVTIKFETAIKGEVVLQAFDVLGNSVAVLENRTLNAGNYQYTFSAKDLGYTAGIYFIKLRIGNDMNTVRVIEME